MPQLIIDQRVKGLRIVQTPDSQNAPTSPAPSTHLPVPDQNDQPVNAASAEFLNPLGQQALSPSAPTMTLSALQAQETVAERGRVLDRAHSAHMTLTRAFAYEEKSILEPDLLRHAARLAADGFGPQDVRRIFAIAAPEFPLMYPGQEDALVRFYELYSQHFTPEGSSAYDALVEQSHSARRVDLGVVDQLSQFIANHPAGIGATQVKEMFDLVVPASDAGRRIREEKAGALYTVLMGSHEKFKLDGLQEWAAQMQRAAPLFVWR